MSPADKRAVMEMADWKIEEFKDAINYGVKFVVLGRSVGGSYLNRTDERFITLDDGIDYLWERFNANT